MQEKPVRGCDCVQARIIGVLAATPIDTGMGVDVVKTAGFPTVGRYLSANPEEQTQLQVLHPSALTELALGVCREMVLEGARGVFLYCNSLAGAVDLDVIRRSLPVKVVTPLDVYETLAKRHRSIAVLAANCQSLAAIEQTIKAVNPSCVVYGGGLLPLTEAVESGALPREITDKLEVGGFIRSLCKMGGEILLLGCTHFPYLAEQITAVSDLPVIDPAEAMLLMLRESFIL